MVPLIEEQSGVPHINELLHIVGCLKFPGFDFVAQGGKVDLELVEAGMVKLALEEIGKNKAIGAILLECTEMPPYSNALRDATGLDGYDAITLCNTFMAGRITNPHLGRSHWKHAF